VKFATLLAAPVLYWLKFTNEDNKFCYEQFKYSIFLFSSFNLSNAQHAYSPCTYRDALKSTRVQEYTDSEQWKDDFYVVPSPISWGIRPPPSHTISINTGVLGTCPVKYPQVQGIANNILNVPFQPIYWHWKCSLTVTCNVDGASGYTFLKNFRCCFILYEGGSNKRLKYFYLIFYWTQNVHNDFIFLRSLYCIPHKCSSTSEVHGYL